MDNTHKNQYLIRVPNALIRDPRCKKIVQTYILINRARYFAGGAGTCLKALVEGSGYRAERRSHAAAIQVEQALQFMIDQDMIVLSNPLQKYRLDDYLHIELTPRFTPERDFTMLSVQDYNAMVEISGGYDPANLVSLFLFLKSSMGRDVPTYWGSQQAIADRVGLHASTIKRYLYHLRDCGFIRISSAGSRKVNIYTLAATENWSEAVATTRENIKRGQVLHDYSRIAGQA